jgi:hypothetical protein
MHQLINAKKNESIGSVVSTVASIFKRIVVGLAFSSSSNVLFVLDSFYRTFQLFHVSDHDLLVCNELRGMIE